MDETEMRCSYCGGEAISTLDAQCDECGAMECCGDECNRHCFSGIFQTPEEPEQDEEPLWWTERGQWA